MTHDTTHAFATRPTLKSIVAQIQSVDVRALAPHEYEDVVTLIEYVRAEALKAHQASDQAGAKLAEREKLVTKREQDVAIRSRVVNAVIVPKRKRYLFG